MKNLFEIASGIEVQEGEDFKIAVQMISAYLNTGSQPARTVDESDPRIQDYNRMTAERQQYDQQRWHGFAQAVDQMFYNNLDAEVASSLEKANKAGALPAVLDMVRKEVVAQIAQEVMSNRWVNEAFPSKMREQWGRTEDLAAWKMSYARPKILARVAAEMKKITPQIVNKAKEQVRKAEQVATRKDVGGQAGGTSARPGKVDYRKLSDDDIYNGKHLVG
jgi:hypothetical protein